MTARTSVQKKLAREERYRKFSVAQSYPLPGPSNEEEDNSLSGNSSGEEFIVTPKRPKANPPVPKDILRRVGPAADRLNLSNATLTGLIANSAGSGTGIR